MWGHKDLDETGQMGEITWREKLPGQQPYFPLRILHRIRVVMERPLEDRSKSVKLIMNKPSKQVWIDEEIQKKVLRMPRVILRLCEELFKIEGRDLNMIEYVFCFSFFTSLLSSNPWKQ